VSVRVEVELNGVRVPLVLDDAAVEAVAAALPEQRGEQQPEFLTIPETAQLLRCKRQRVDDLLSSGRLTRVKDGSRVLIRRAEIDAYLSGDGRQAR
jgi:excisionase family DNA binding protein